MKRNYHGSRVEGKNPAPKRLSLVLALVLILVCAVGGTVAYLVTHTDPVTNTFTPGNVTCEVVENVNANVKEDVGVKNTGNVPAYIRVAVVANTVDKDGSITGAADVSAKLCGDNWVAGTDGYYYYKGVVDPQKQTDGNLLKGDINLNGIQVTILASAIQATPADAVNDAWGMSYADGVWAKN